MTPSHRIDAGLWACASAALVFASVLAAPAVLAGSDLYWHIVAGRWMIENQAVLRINLFSFTFPGQTWINTDWLSEILLAGAYVSTGWNAVLALGAVVAAFAAGLFGFFLSRGRRDAVTVLWLVLALAVGAGAVRALPFLLALPCLVIWTAGLVRAGKVPPMKLLPVMLVWANLSSSFVIGLILALVLAAEAIWQTPRAERSAVARAWAVFCGFTLLLGLITPTGIFGFVHAMRALAVSRPVLDVLPLLLALPAASVLLPHRRMVFRLAFLTGLFWLALTTSSGRLFFAVAAPLLAAGSAEEEPFPRLARPLTTLIALILAAGAVRLLVPLVRADDRFAPQTALAQVPAAVKRQPVFNETAFGGYLIFNDIKPFLDSRPIYPKSFRKAAADPGTLAATLTRYRIRWTILSPQNPATAEMDRLSGWHRLTQDQWAVVHVKDGSR